MTIHLNTEICLPTGAVLAAPATTAIHAATLPNGTIEDWTGTIAAQPGTVCNTGLALAMVVTDADSSITSARIRVRGTDVHGRLLDEVAETNVAGSASYPLTKPFHTITDLEVQGVGFTGADRISVGVLGVLGLPVVITNVSQVVRARVDATLEVAPTLSVANNTWTPASAPNGARRFYLNVLDAAA